MNRKISRIEIFMVFIALSIDTRPHLSRRLQDCVLEADVPGKRGESVTMDGGMCKLTGLLVKNTGKSTCLIAVQCDFSLCVCVTCDCASSVHVTKQQCTHSLKSNK